MVHQRSDRLFLRVRSGRAIGIQHLIPLIGGIAEIGGKDSGVSIEGVPPIGMRACSFGRILMRFHQLRCRRSYTAGITALIVIFRAGQIIRIALIPQGATNRRYGSIRGLLCVLGKLVERNVLLS